MQDNLYIAPTQHHKRAADSDFLYNPAAQHPKREVELVIYNNNG
jgi:hypothetical protein